MKERASAVFGGARQFGSLAVAAALGPNRRTRLPERTNTGSGKREAGAAAGRSSVRAARLKLRFWLVKGRLQPSPTQAHRRHFTHPISYHLHVHTLSSNINHYSAALTEHRTPPLSPQDSNCYLRLERLTPTSSTTPTQSSLLNLLGIHFLDTPPHQYITASK